MTLAGAEGSRKAVPRLARTLLTSVTIQVGTQVLAFATGLVVVNSLAKQEYAFYAMALAVSAGVSMVAHAGLTSAMLSLSQGARKRNFTEGDLLASIVWVRTRTTLVAGGIAVPLVYLFVLRGGASAWWSALISLAIAAQLALSVRGSVYGDFLLMSLEHRTVQGVAIIGGAVRLTAMGGVYLASSGNAVIALISGLVSGCVTNRLLKHAVRAHGCAIGARWSEAASAALRLYRSKLAATSFSALQGQIVILLLGALSLTDNLAEVSALARYCAVFASAGVLTRWLVSPRLARMEIKRAQIFFAVVIAACGGILGFGLLIASVSLESLLNLLGPSYSHLEQELMIVLAGGAIGSLADVVSAMNDSRGWVGWSWVQIPLTSGTLLLFLQVANVKSSLGAAALVLVTAIPWLISQLIQFCIGALRELNGSADEGASLRPDR